MTHTAHTNIQSTLINSQPLQPTQALDLLINGNDLTEPQAFQLMLDIMTGNVCEPVLAALLTALRIKGETISEITGAAQAMRELSLKVKVHDTAHLVDIVGTGGDGQHLFNVSTASTFVASAAGARVAKHGNRGVSSSSGSSDLLEQAGIALDLTIEQTQACIENVGVGFLYAPNHHKAMKYAIGVRKALKMRSIFNLLGPLTNPAGVQNLVVGVFDKSLCEPLAHVYKNLGANHVMVVHSDDGLDEISLASATFVAELKDSTVTSYSITPEDVGIQTQTLDGLQVADKSASLVIITSAFTQDVPSQNTGQTSTNTSVDVANKAKDMIALNAGAALYVSGITKTHREGVALALETLANGSALDKLNKLADYTQNFKQ